MTKAQKDLYWMECIQKCRTSGQSDYTWCRENGISPSTFYYNVGRLRKQNCETNLPMQSSIASHEVVPVHFNEPENTVLKTTTHRELNSAAVNIEFNGIVVSINNGADTSVIIATLNALQQLC